MRPLPTLVEMVDAAIAEHGERTAIVAPDGTPASYRRLDALADDCAAALCAAGVTPGDRVGVCRSKSVETVAALLGIMRAGAAYVPVDPASPPERNRTILADCAVSAVVLDAAADARLAEVAGAARLVGDWAEGGARPARAPTSGDLAYILYTSGSTGRPKGVCLEHRHAASFVDWCVRTFRPRPEDRCSSHAPFHFDLSILDLWMPLASGASVALVDEALARDPRGLPGFVAERGISVWYSVPSILALMAEHGDLESHAHERLRIVCFAGEVFPLPALRRLRRAWPEPEFWNLYGPTETNVCTAHRLPPTIDDARTEPYPIGAACDHCEIRLVDDDGVRVATGAIGRIVCRGAPVMRTYWGRRPEEVPGFVEIDGARWYDTGDLGEAGPDGAILFRGRRDRMVKRHGYRIELGEIEAALERMDVLREVAVWAESVEGATRIRAAVSPRGDAPPTIIALRAHCGAHLPPYMNPDRFHVMPALPRTSTGKIDYQALARGVGDAATRA